MDRWPRKLERLICALRMCDINSRAIKILSRERERERPKKELYTWNKSFLEFIWTESNGTNKESSWKQFMDNRKILLMQRIIAYTEKNSSSNSGISTTTINQTLKKVKFSHLSVISFAETSNYDRYRYNIDTTKFRVAVDFNKNIIANDITILSHRYHTLRMCSEIII